MAIVCFNPFVHAIFTDTGEIYCCCPGWAKVGAIGNINKSKFKDIWNGEKVKNMRQEIYNGEYSKICNDSCPRLLEIRSGKNFYEKEVYVTPEIIKEINEKKLILTTKPTRVSVMTDPTCNLSCIMCRQRKIYHKTKLEISYNSKVYEWIRNNLCEIRLLTLSGLGEPFFSDQIKNFVINTNAQEYPNLNLHFITNGQLLNENMWDKIKKFNISEITVSVNAAKKKTYEKIMKGAKWDILQSNMLMLSKLRKESKFRIFGISMVVMLSNVGEMCEFIDLARKWNCDHVEFIRIDGDTAGRENFFDYPNISAFSKLRKKIMKETFDEAAQ